MYCRQNHGRSRNEVWGAGISGRFDRPACLTNAMDGLLINALWVIPFYTGKKYYVVIYDDDGIARWAGYRNRDNAGD